MQILGRVAEGGGELIERRERGVDLFERRISLFHRAHFAQPDLAQACARALRASAETRANDIDIFETGLAIEPKVGQVLPEESETFAEKENGDQREHDDGDERVAAEERLDALLDGRLRAARCRSRRNESAGIGDAFHAERTFAETSAARQFL